MIELISKPVVRDYVSFIDYADGSSAADDMLDHWSISDVKEWLGGVFC